MTVTEYLELEEQYGAHNYRPLDVVLERADRVWVYDVDGRRYLDCLAAYSAVNQGHCHPRIVKACVEQARKLTLTSRAFRNDQLPRLCKQLHDLTGMDMALLMNSGAEAVETALKAARKWGYTVKGIPKDQAEIIVCAGNFHGRTISVVSFSTEAQYQDGFGPFTPGFRVVPFGDADALERAITPNTCAFLVEPIQGEAGIVVPPDGYLTRTYAACRDRNVLFIADEIQSGLGRAGKLFAHQYEPVTPDAIIVGKALSGGLYPVSAVLARRSAALGAYFIDRLRTIESPVVKEIRGRGLWIGIELTEPARPYCEALKEEGVLCKETHERVIRIAPPLVIEVDEIDWAFERLRRVLTRP